jgi:hypothetical protein
MANVLGEFTLTDSISNTRFSDYDRTFHDYGLVPTALLFFDWSSDIVVSFSIRVLI